MTNTETKLNTSERPHRFQFTEWPTLQVIVRRLETNSATAPSAKDACATEFCADLDNFSCSGLSLQLPFEVASLERLAVRLEFSELDFCFESDATVRHAREDGDYWVAGCSIDSPLPNSLVDYLATAVGKDRRRHPRDTVWGQGTMKLKDDEQGSRVEYLNLSKGGFCAKTLAAPLNGERVKFLVLDKVRNLKPITARVRWTRAVEGEDTYLVGCSFTEEAGYSIMKSALSIQKTELPKKREPESRISGYIVAACLLSMLIPPAISIALDVGNKQRTVVSPPAITRAEHPDRNVQRSIQAPNIHATKHQPESKPAPASLPNKTAMTEDLPGELPFEFESEVQQTETTFESELKIRQSESPYWLFDGGTNGTPTLESVPIPPVEESSSRRSILRRNN